MNENVKQPAVDQMTEKLQAALNSLEQGGFSETSIPAGDLQGSGKWIQAGDFKATEADDAGPLTYKFNGNSIQVSTVKGDDHGVNPGDDPRSKRETDLPRRN